MAHRRSVEARPNRPSAAVVFCTALIGCSAMAPRGASNRLAVRGERAIVHVEGRGTVRAADAIECGVAGSRCEGSFTDITTPALVATPEPGWEFLRWEWRALDAPLTPSSAVDGHTHAYTAVFARLGPRAARP